MAGSPMALGTPSNAWEPRAPFSGILPSPHRYERQTWTTKPGAGWRVPTWLLPFCCAGTPPTANRQQNPKFPSREESPGLCQVGKSLPGQGGHIWLQGSVAVEVCQTPECLPTSREPSVSSRPTHLRPSPLSFLLIW